MLNRLFCREHVILIANDKARSTEITVDKKWVLERYMVEVISQVRIFTGWSYGRKLKRLKMFHFEALIFFTIRELQVEIAGVVMHV